MASMSVAFIASLVLFLQPPSQIWTEGSLFDELRQLAIRWTYIFLAAAFVAVITKTSSGYSRSWFLSWGALSFLFSATARVILMAYVSYRHREGRNRRSLVLIGGGRLAEHVLANVFASKWRVFNPIGYFDDGEDEGYANRNIDRLGCIDDIETRIGEIRPDETWILLPLSQQQRIQHIMHALRHETCDIRYVPDFAGLDLINHSFSQVSGISVINLTESPFSDARRMLKNLEDWILGTIILVALLPILLLLGIAVKVTSRGPIFYKQERLSWNGKPFKMLKFRTMPVDAEKSTGAVWAKRGDNRPTTLGAFLRKTSLDELPQFINVLKGDMSIVGPRPERPFFVEKFKHEVPGYMKKHMVKGGITGWAQVHGLRGDTDLARRIEYDIYYINNWSLSLDLKIILLTVFKVFVDKNAY